MTHHLRALCVLCVSIHALIASEATSIKVGPKPESVTRGFDGKLYLSLMGESRALGDADGSIVCLDEKTSTVTTLVTGLDDPKGIVFTGTHLITADFKTVWRIDASGQKSILAAAKDFPTSPLFLNDVALSPDGRSVLVTDMGARDKILGPNGLHPLGSPEAAAVPALGRVYRISLDTSAVSIALDHNPAMPCPNGVDALPNGVIRVAEFFNGTIFEFNGSETTTLSTNHRGGDGIVHDSDGNIYISEVFTGQVWRISPSAEKTLLIKLPSAADHILDGKRLLIPDTKSGALVILPLEK